MEQEFISKPVLLNLILLTYPVDVSRFNANFTGKCNTSFSDIDECLTEDLCKNNGTCVNNEGSYVCLCTESWLGSHCNNGTSFSLSCFL